MVKNMEEILQQNGFESMDYGLFHHLSTGLVITAHLKHKLLYWNYLNYASIEDSTIINILRQVAADLEKNDIQALIINEDLVDKNEPEDGDIIIACNDESLKQYYNSKLSTCCSDLYLLERIGVIFKDTQSGCHTEIFSFIPSIDFEHNKIDILGEIILNTSDLKPILKLHQGETIRHILTELSNQMAQYIGTDSSLLLENNNLSFQNGVYDGLILSEINFELADGELYFSFDVISANIKTENGEDTRQDIIQLKIENDHFTDESLKNAQMVLDDLKEKNRFMNTF